jgi:predicted O-linked N-acetylglucosamine transferase (SPINDLY family)
MLANCRIAPIQVTGNGNPGSTFGAQIDYFITGQSAERLDLLEMNYYEKVILAPGSGSRPERPPCVPTRPQKASEPVIVNVPWGVTKYNYPTLKLLRDVQICSPISIIYHFFPGCGVNRYNCAYPFLRDMDDIFKGQAVYYPNQPYQQHLKNLEDGHFSLDSYPWGGYNSVVDALFLGIPVITWEGNQWYNRVASYLLRRVGLSELVATTEQEYEQLIMKMVTDRAYRDTMASRVQSLDLSVLFEAPEPKYFVTAIDELMERK